MWPFKRKNSTPPAASTAKPVRDQVPDLQAVVDAMRESRSTPKAVPAGNPLLKLLPIGRIVDNVFQVIRDPNGKLSSRRAGAGALVVAGISFLTEGKQFEAITCLGFATVLFILVKYTGDPQP